jgi:hypothetical protein
VPEQPVRVMLVEPEILHILEVVAEVAVQAVLVAAQLMLI